MRTFILATHNEKKCEEMQRILEPLGISVKTADSLGINLSEVDENGTTFAENAFLKASMAMMESGYDAIADDSGLCVDYIGGKPGVLSARYAGPKSNDKKNVKKLLTRLEGVPESKRDAHFVCSICVCFKDGEVLHVEDTCDGKIAISPRGRNGFGYDPIFAVGKKTFAQMSDDEKDKISHRAKALKKLKRELVKY